MKVAIDPGSKATGVVVFLQGDTISKTFYGNNKKPFPESRREMADRILGWLDGLERSTGDTVKAIVIEGFPPHVPHQIASRLMKLFLYTGYLHGRAEAFVDARGGTVREISKGTKPKKEAMFLARAYNFQGNTEHEIDAFHLGLLAGFKARLA